MAQRISAVICTRDRVAYLSEALASLREQSLRPDEFEIIVVDNGSSDGTAGFVEDACRAQTNLRYLFDARVGLSHARNQGWRGARAPIVAYLDDDAIAPPDWLERILASFDSIAPRPACVCGPVEPIWGAERPHWLDEDLGRYYSILTRSEGAGWLLDGYFCGANMAFRRNVLERLDGFDTGLGRKGRALLSNEEVFLQRRLSALGEGVYYDPRVCIRHHVPPVRLTRRWITRRVYWQGVSNAILWARLDGVGARQRAKAAAGSLRQMIRLTAALARAGFSGDRERVFRATLRLVRRSGHFHGLLSR